MPGYSTALEMDDIQSPVSDYSSYSQAHVMTSSSSGTLMCYPHTGQADLHGSSWDTAVEGLQNFSEYGDLENMHPDDQDYTYQYGHVTPRKDQAESLDDFPSKWAVAGASSAEPMRRATSKSSHGSQKHRSPRSSSSKLSRQSMSSTSSQGPAHMSSYDMAGNSYAFQDASVHNGVNQYLMSDADALPPAALFHPGMMGLATDGLPYETGLQSAMTHVDPTCTQMHMDFVPSLSGNSPTGSWGSSSSGGSRRASPGLLNDTWSPTHGGSPTETHDSSSPELVGQSPRNFRKDEHHMLSQDTDIMAGMDDGMALPGSFGSRRPSSEGETARDHYLYKDAHPNPDDGLFHCPWEGDSSCNHKAEKLKCNYDKFVDSHLKPYRCKHDSCEHAKFSSTACLLRHEREAHAMHGHGDKPYLCTYDGCERSVPGNGFPRQWNLRDHMRRVHHDNGASLPVSPPAAGNGHSKGRKKGSRKTAQKVTPAEKSASAKADAYHKFQDHRKALSSIVERFPRPDDASGLQLFQDAQDHLFALTRISTTLLKAERPDLASGSFQRSFPQQTD